MRSIEIFFFVSFVQVQKSCSAANVNIQTTKFKWMFAKHCDEYNVWRVKNNNIIKQSCHIHRTRLRNSIKLRHICICFCTHTYSFVHGHAVCAVLWLVWDEDKLKTMANRQIIPNIVNGFTHFNRIHATERSNTEIIHIYRSQFI